MRLQGFNLEMKKELTIEQEKHRNEVNRLSKELD